jgi:hypothetical protein
MRHSLILMAGIASLAACVSSPQWSAESWNGLAPQTIGTKNFNFFAAPLDGQGFKLKLTLATDGNFRVQEGDTFPAELEEAARAAAPEGCIYRGLTLLPDGGAEVDYTCS